MSSSSEGVRVVSVGLSSTERACVAASLGVPACAAAPEEAGGLLASPEVDLVVMGLETGAVALGGPLPRHGAGPPALVLYEPARAADVDALAGRRHLHVLAREGDYLCRLPLAVRAALGAGQLVRERVAALAGQKHHLDSVIGSMSEGLLVIDREYRSATINPAARELLGVDGLEELSVRLRDGAVDEGLHPIFWLEAHGEESKPVRCWETRRCSQEACPAYGCGLFPCWLYDGTLCHGAEPEGFPRKLGACRECEVYEHNARLTDPQRAHGRREMRVAQPCEKVLVSLSAPVVDEAGRFLGVVKLLRDVTTERKLEQVRANFASFITHELRTPLTSVSGFLGLMLGGYTGPFTAAQRRQLEAAHRQAKRLGRLVDNLLHVAEIDSGRLQLHRGHFDLVPVLADTAEALEPQASQAGVDLRVLPGEGALPVHADRERIVQVLTNLVANGIKFTSRGGRVDVSARADAEGVVVEVADTGRGIAPEELPHIFDRFFRVRSLAAPRTRGTGLGLTICRGIVEAHGGRIWAQSTLGEGSRFLFSLPASQGE